jgi:hypothetical protein
LLLGQQLQVLLQQQRFNKYKASQHHGNAHQAAMFPVCGQARGWHACCFA